MSEKYQVLARKYRPQAFSEVVGQEAAVTTLKNAIRFEKIAHAYLFCGTRGVGKTTLARLFAKALNCQSPTQDLEPCGKCSSCLDTTAGQSLDVIEIDGASNRGIDDIRQINETVGYAPSHGKYKIYIIDEVHMLTKEAFNALLKTLEEPPASAKFFFATTEPHKVLPTIISRCQRFDLARISPELIANKLQQIAVDLGRSVDYDALQLIASFSEGSLRDAESLFDQILCFAENQITAATVRKSLGLVPQELFLGLDQAFSTYNLGYAFELVEQLFQTGKDLAHFLEQLVEHYRMITLIRTVGEKNENSSYVNSARLYTQQQCLHILDLLINAEGSFQKSPFPRITLESILLQIIRSKHRIPVEAIVRKLTESPIQPIEIKEVEEPRAAVTEAQKETLSASQAQNFVEQFAVKTPKTFAEQILSPESVTNNLIKAAMESDHRPENFGKKFASEIPKVEAPKPIVEPTLKAVPFNPFTTDAQKLAPVVEPKPVPKPVAPIAEVKPKPIVEPKPVVKTAAPVEPTAGGKDPTHYDTLMRFTSIELEGTVKN